MVVREHTIVKFIDCLTQHFNLQFEGNAYGVCSDKGNLGKIQNYSTMRMLFETHQSFCDFNNPLKKVKSVSNRRPYIKPFISDKLFCSHNLVKFLPYGLIMLSGFGE